MILANFELSIHLGALKVKSTITFKRRRFHSGKYNGFKFKIWDRVKIIVMKQKLFYF